MVEEVTIHIRDEYNTYDWVMEGLLERAGFAIDEKRESGKFAVTYICNV